MSVSIFAADAAIKAALDASIGTDDQGVYCMFAPTGVAAQRGEKPVVVFTTSLQPLSSFEDDAGIMSVAVVIVDAQENGSAGLLAVSDKVMTALNRVQLTVTGHVAQPIEWLGTARLANDKEVQVSLQFRFAIEVAP